MGIKNLTKFLRLKYPAIYKKEPLSFWENKKIAIDSSIYIYKFKCMAIKEASYKHEFTFDQTTGWNEPSEELVKSMFKRRFELFIAMFKQHNVTPVFVFDGKAPDEKNDTRKKRKEKNQLLVDSMTRYKKDKTKLKEYKNSLSQCLYVKDTDFIALYKILDENGVEKVIAKGEAEQLASYYCKTNKFDAVVSTDTDVFAYGCPIVWVSIGQQLGVWIVEYITFQSLLAEMKIDEEQFLCFCIMCGTDFNDRVKNYGPVKCLKLVQDLKNIGAIREKYPLFNDLPFEKIYQLMKQEPHTV